MIEKITLDMLTQDGVSVKTQRYYDDNGTLYPIGQPHRKAYINSIRGDRKWLTNYRKNNKMLYLLFGAIHQQ